MWWPALTAMRFDVVSYAQLGLGLAEPPEGNYRVASRHLERAAAPLDKLRAVNEDVEMRQRLAWAQVTLARSPGPLIKFAVPVGPEVPVFDERSARRGDEFGGFGLRR